MMKNRLFNFLLLGLGIVILIFAIMVRIGQSTQVTAANGYPAPVNDLPAPLNHCEQEKARNDARPPQSKSDMSEEEYRQCIAALTQAPKTKMLKPEETPLPTRAPKDTHPRRIAGNGILIEGLLGMRDPRVFVQTNTWYEKSGDRFIYVYGGIKRNASPDLTHSAVAVVVSDLAGNWLSEGGMYEAPVQAGELTILDARGSVLVLTTPNGNYLYFDVQSRKFITPDAETLASSQQRKVGNGLLIERRGSPFDSSYEVTNQWYQESNGKRITVFSGRTKEKNGQAVVLITNSQGEPKTSTQAEAYSIPDYVASDWEYLRIFNVIQDKVILVGKRGGEYVFDLSTKRFLPQSEAAQLPDDPDLISLEASYEKIRSEASKKSNNSVITPTLPAYP